MRTQSRSILTMLLVALMLVGGALTIDVTPAQAAGTVTDCSTFGAVGTSGTLADALNGGGTVTFACSGTIIVPEITIGDTTVIDGNGYDVTLSGNNANRVFKVSNGARLDLINITIAYGNSSEAGGGIMVEQNGLLRLNLVTLKDNVTDLSGGAIAYFSRNQLKISNSTFLRNEAKERFSGGGAIYYYPYGIANSPAIIENSTFSGNVASGVNTASGGAIFGDTDSFLNGSVITMNITNSTFSGNSARKGGAISVRAGVVKTNGLPNTTNLNIANSTFANNKDLGGNPDDIIATVDTLGSTTNIKLDNTIITGGCESQGTQTQPFTSLGYNISTDATCNFTQPTDRQNTDPLLDSLADNGGPTQTHALLPGSPAIDAGMTDLAVDQRGIARPQRAADDIGAYEASCSFPASVGSEAELNFAIGCYNVQSAAGDYAITLTQDINLTASTMPIDNDTVGVALMVEGGGFSVDGQGTADVRPFTIETDTTVTIQNMTITGGSTRFSGGIANDGTLTVLSSTISGNQAIYGGGIENDGTLSLINSTVSNNRASDQANSGLGGGIYNSGTLNIGSSTIADNEAILGGGIYNRNGATLNLFNTIVADNTARSLPDCFDFGTETAEYSLIETASPNACGTGGANNLVGDPNLGPLQDNGGPTHTHALLPGSWAIDAGMTDLAVDQRGETRPFGLADDMGAFELHANGTIIITKHTSPADLGTFEFTHDITTSGSTFPLDGGESETFLDVVPGTYTISESAAAGWTLTDISCDDQNSSRPSTHDLAAREATIELEPGETVTCTFLNSEDDLILIRKWTIPEGGTGFEFSHNIDQSGNFILDDGDLQIFDAAPGNRTITELVPSGYEITAITCDVYGPGDTVPTTINGDTATGSVNLQLSGQPGSVAYCEFINTKVPTLTVVKDADPADGTDFPFELRGDATQDFTLDGEATTNTYTMTLPAGNYTLQEIVPPGWYNTKMVCGGASFVGLDEKNMIAYLQLEAGDDATCTFTNKETATLTVVKDASPADGTDFLFFVSSDDYFRALDLDDAVPDDNDGITDMETLTVPVGSFLIEEAVLDGWANTVIQCDGASNVNADPANGTVTFDLAAGNDATCTFVNKALVSLTVTKAGTGSGTVTSVPAGISCGTDCSESYPLDTLVTLTAIADTGSTFTGWSGAGCSGTGTCQVTMDAAKSVTATFDTVQPNQYILTVAKDGTGSGTVTSTPAGIDCGSACSADFPAGTVVTLTATAGTGSTFAGWSGAGCSGTGTCVVTMDAAKSVTATFDLEEPKYYIYLPVIANKFTP